MGKSINNSQHEPKTSQNEPNKCQRVPKTNPIIFFDCLYESCRSSVKFWNDIPFGKSKVLLANYMKEKEPCKLNWNLAKEPSDIESEVENPEDEV